MKRISRMLSRNTSEELETLIYFIDTTKRKIINFRFLLILKKRENYSILISKNLRIFKHPQISSFYLILFRVDKRYYLF